MLPQNVILQTLLGTLVASQVMAKSNRETDVSCDAPNVSWVFPPIGTDAQPTSGSVDGIAHLGIYLPA